MIKIILLTLCLWAGMLTSFITRPWTISAGTGSAYGTQNKTAGTSTGAACGGNFAAGLVNIVIVAKDNTSTTDADNSEITSMSDASGNTYTKLKEWTNGNGSAATGATVSIWKCKLANAIDVTSTLTINYSGSTAAKHIASKHFSVAAGNDLQLAGSTQGVGDGAGFTMTLSGLASKEYLWISATALEMAAISLGADAGYTLISSGSNGTSGGGAASNMILFSEYKIATATTSGTIASSGQTVDQVGVTIALEEFTPVSNPRRVYRIN